MKDKNLGSVYFDKSKNKWVCYYYVHDNITNEKIKRNILKEAELNLNIPLTSLTIEVPIETKAKQSNGYLINEVTLFLLSL